MIAPPPPTESELRELIYEQLGVEPDVVHAGAAIIGAVSLAPKYKIIGSYTVFQQRDGTIAAAPAKFNPLYDMVPA